jgi:hypothetical protein
VPITGPDKSKVLEFLQRNLTKAKKLHEQVQNVAPMTKNIAQLNADIVALKNNSIDESAFDEIKQRNKYFEQPAASQAPPPKKSKSKAPQKISVQQATNLEIKRLDVKIDNIEKKLVGINKFLREHPKAEHAYTLEKAADLSEELQGLVKQREELQKPPPLKPGPSIERFKQRVQSVREYFGGSNNTNDGNSNDNNNNDDDDDSYRMS